MPHTPDRDSIRHRKHPAHLMPFAVCVCLVNSLGLAGCGALKDMGEQTKQMGADTRRLRELTESMNDRTAKLVTLTEQVAGLTSLMQSAMSDLITLTKALGANTIQMKDSMGLMLSSMQGLAQKMEAMGDKMSQMLTAMNGMSTQMASLSENMRTMTQLIQGMNALMTAMGSSLEETNRKMSTMVATTEELATLMRGMRTEMARLGSLMERMETRTGQLARQREGIAQQIRREALRLLLERGRAMESRLSQAAVYVRAFEFQLWENIVDDTPARREMLFATAVREYLTAVRGVIDGQRPAPEVLLSTNGPDPKLASLLALAYTLGEIDDTQREAAAHPKHGFEIVSMLDLLERSLLARATLDRGEGAHAPEFVRTALFYEDELTYLLVLRVNILAAVALDKLSDAKQRPLLERLVLLARSAGLLPRTWKPRWAGLNAAEFDQMALDLERAHQGFEVLLKAGVKPAVDPKLIRLMEGAELPSPASDASALSRARDRLVRAWRQLSCDWKRLRGAAC